MKRILMKSPLIQIPQMIHILKIHLMMKKLIPKILIAKTAIHPMMRVRTPVTMKTQQTVLHQMTASLPQTVQVQVRENILVTLH